jgi:hypothetical protein
MNKLHSVEEDKKMSREGNREGYGGMLSCANLKAFLWEDGGNGDKPHPWWPRAEPRVKP